MTITLLPHFKLVHLTPFLLFVCGGCQPEKLAMVGKEPPLTHIKNPNQFHNYRPVTMPMPDPQPQIKRVNSLWQEGASSFFKDQRARNIGDIFTVAIDIKNETANLYAKTNTNNPTNTISDRNTQLVSGYKKILQKFTPNALNFPNLLAASGQSQHAGHGNTERKDTINTKIAATIVQILPNGNLVIWGHQEVRVNTELRNLSIAGIVRPEDIRNDNTIEWHKVSEGRFGYGGRGHITNTQQPSIAQQVIEAISPF